MREEDVTESVLVTFQARTSEVVTKVLEIFRWAGTETKVTNLYLQIELMSIIRHTSERLYYQSLVVSGVPPFSMFNTF